MKKLLPVVVGLVAVLQIASSQVIVTNRNQLLNNDSLDFAQFGSDFTSLPNTLDGTTLNGNGVHIASSSATINRVDEGTSWHGNFTIGDHLLWSKDNYSVLSFDFANPVYGAGLQIMNNPYGNFTAFVFARDAIGNPIAEFALNGVSNGNEDGSAIFLGVYSGADNISSLTYFVSPQTDPNFTGFAVNDMTIQSVPEPASFVALAVGIVGLVSRKRRS